MYIYIYTERERERERYRVVCCTRFGAESVAKNSGRSCRTKNTGRWGASGRRRAAPGVRFDPEGLCAKTGGGKNGAIAQPGSGQAMNSRRCSTGPSKGPGWAPQE